MINFSLFKMERFQYGAEVDYFRGTLSNEICKSFPGVSKKGRKKLIKTGREGTATRIRAEMK